MAVNWPTPIEGGCACGTLRYRLEESPMFVHCCNCRECQRQNGTAFALNAFIETEKVTALPPEESPEDAKVVQPLHILMPSQSGTGQLIARCPRCYTVVWSYYGGVGPHTRFIRVGTVDLHGKDGKPLNDVLEPNVYIYTKFKMPWVEFPKGDAEKTTKDEFYNPMEVWPQDVKDRWEKLLPKSQEWKNDKDWKRCKGLHIDVNLVAPVGADESLERETQKLSLQEE